jgi:hypothetical protein
VPGKPPTGLFFFGNPLPDPPVFGNPLPATREGVSKKARDVGSQIQMLRATNKPTANNSHGAAQQQRNRDGDAAAPHRQ